MAIDIAFEKTYQPDAIEKKWYDFWEKSGYFAAQGTGPTFCLVIPPPNVTGTLHMGHGLEISLMDALVRYHRMCGDNTHWQVGTDHAGIATQMVVERELANEGKDRHLLGRAAFEERVWQWKHHSGGVISQQLRRMGASTDWTREKFTMDPSLSHAVRHAFITLYDEGLIYRKKRLVNWDPHFRTAISDLEVLTEEENGNLWYLRYALVNHPHRYLVVATTRPETLFGDQAVAINPTDTRYSDLIGQYVRLPLTDRTIPIIADSYVEPEFGSGCVKITPAHDFNDYEVGARHHLTPLNIFTLDAHLNDNVPEAYRGLEKMVARKRVVQDLEAQEAVEKTEPYKIRVPRGDRSGVVIEPMLTDQWFVKIQSLADPAILAVENAQVQFVPKQWENTYFAWMRDIQDWCISRQLWWGHRIPAWYDDSGQVYVGDNEKAVREKYDLPANRVLTQDEDVLDTWFSAALWPFATLGWPDHQAPEFNTFYPTQVLITGFDIIFFWVARMMMFGLKFTNRAPFQDVYIHGLICDQDGQKMSKSKGNVLDPLDLVDGISLDDLIAKRTQSMMQSHKAKKIEQDTRKQYPDGIPAFGTDAVRFTFCALSSSGRQIRFELSRVEGYRNFCNKLWNAARFVLMNLDSPDAIFDAHHISLEGAAELLYIGKLFYDAVDIVRQELDRYRFDLAANACYEFVWYEYCDWFIELSKPFLNASDVKIRAAAQFIALDILEKILRLLHPFIPFITEEIWQQIAPKLQRKEKASLMLMAYPSHDDPDFKRYHHATTLEVAAEIDWLKKIILALRNVRSEMNIPPKQMMTLYIQNGTDADKTKMARHQSSLQALAKVENAHWLSAHEKPPIAATTIVGNLTLQIPLEGLLNKEQELSRVEKALLKAQKEYEKLEQKLSNPQYLAHGQPDVLAQEQQKLAELKHSIEKLVAHRDNVALLASS